MINPVPVTIHETTEDKFIIENYSLKRKQTQPLQLSPTQQKISETTKQPNQQTKKFKKNDIQSTIISYVNSDKFNKFQSQTNILSTQVAQDRESLEQKENHQIQKQINRNENLNQNILNDPRNQSNPFQQNVMKYNDEQKISFESSIQGIIKKSLDESIETFRQKERSGLTGTKFDYYISNLEKDRINARVKRQNDIEMIDSINSTEQLIKYFEYPHLRYNIASAAYQKIFKLSLLSDSQSYNSPLRFDNQIELTFSKNLFVIRHNPKFRIQEVGLLSEFQYSERDPRLTKSYHGQSSLFAETVITNQFI